MLKLATKFAPTASAFATAHEAGFAWAEIYLDAAILANWQEAVALAGACPLGYALHFPNRLRDPGPALEQTVALYRGIAARCVVIHQPMFDRHAEALLRLGPELSLAIENHHLTPEALIDWAEKAPGMALDIEHLWAYTWPDVPLAQLLQEVRGFLGRFGGKLRHVHLPGYLPGQPWHRPMYCSRDLVFGMFALLDEMGFEGLVVSEVEVEFQCLHELRMDVLLFEAWQARQSAPGG
jgi:hypothetical protein